MEIQGDGMNDGNISLAERQIAQILATLETQTDSIVKELSIQDMEITAFGDSRRQMQRRVVIELEKTPGSNWDAGE
jgi:hypothetical protein